MTIGYADMVVSDRGGEFISGVMKELQNLFCTKHHIISPFSPHVNGMIERAHRSLGEYVRSYCEDSTMGESTFVYGEFCLQNSVNFCIKI